MRSYQYRPASDTTAARESISLPSQTANFIARGRPAIESVPASPIEETLPAPNIFTVAKEWVELRRKQSELDLRESELIDEVAKTKKLINDQHLGAWSPPFVLKATDTGPNDAADERARKLLGELAPHVASEKNLMPLPTPAPIARMLELGVELDAVHAAKKLLAPEIRRAFLEGSKKLRELIAPEFKKLQKDVFLALIAFGDAMLAYDRFMTRHRNMALSLLRPVIGPIQGRGVLSIGDPRDRYSPLRQFLQQAIDAGHLGELPREWTAPCDRNKFWTDPV